MVYKAPTIKKVRAADLITDIRVQRELDPRRVRAMVADFNINAIGTLCVSKRDDDTMVVLDGWHRRAALIETDNEETLVNAEVYTGLDLADEAAIFRYRNNTAKVGFLDRFRVRLIEGEPVAVAVEALARKHGWAVVNNVEGNDNSLPILHSVKKLEQIYRQDEELASATLRVATVAWHYDSSSVDYRVLDGLAKFLGKYWDDVDQDDLINKLSVVNGGPDVLISRTQGVREMFNTSSGQAMAVLITDAYNKGKKHGGSRLPSWLS